MSHKHIKTGQKKGKPFVMLDKEMLASKEWQELSTSAKIVYIQIKKNFNGANSGKIAFKYSELKMSDPTISRSLKELRKKDWITRTKHGGMFRFYCLYGLTFSYDVKRG